jgi:hypothetical protein
VNLSALKRAAQAFGAHVDQTDGTIDVLAPPGKVWAATGTHAVVASLVRGAEVTAACADAYKRIAHGLADCLDPLCDYCNEVES